MRLSLFCFPSLEYLQPSSNCLHFFILTKFFFRLCLNVQSLKALFGPTAPATVTPRQHFFRFRLSFTRGHCGNPCSLTLRDLTVAAPGPAQAAAGRAGAPPRPGCATDATSGARERASAETSAPLGYLYEGHEQTRYPYRFLSIEKSSYFHVDLSSVGERKTSDSSLKNVSVTDVTLGGIAMRSTLFPKVSLGIIKYL